MNTVDNDVLTLVNSTYINCLVGGTHVILLVHVPFIIPLKCHLGVQMVQHPLDLADTACGRELILAVITDEVQELRIEVVESLN